MSEPVTALDFDLSKSVEVELSHKTLELLVPEIFRYDLSLHSLDVKHIDVGF